MHIGFRSSAKGLVVVLIAMSGVLAPVASSADSFGIERYAWSSSSAFERAGLPHINTVAEVAIRRMQPGSTLDGLAIVRLVKSLPFEPVSIGPRPRLPSDSDPAMGLVFVYRFNFF